MDSAVSGRHPMYQNVPVIFNRAGRPEQIFLDIFISFLSTLHLAVHISGLDRQLEYKRLTGKLENLKKTMLQILYSSIGYTV